MLSLLLAISFKCFRSSKKFLIVVFVVSCFELRYKTKDYFAVASNALHFAQCNFKIF